MRQDSLASTITLWLAILAMMSTSGLVADDDQTFVDGRTGLMWTKYDSQENSSHNFAEGDCGYWRTGGHTDWRLPTIEELEQMYDPDNVSSIWADWEIHTVDGIELSTPFVWSATMEDEGNAWTLDFRTKERRLRPVERSTNLRTICVREPE